MSSSAIAMVTLMIVGCAGSNDSDVAETAADDAWTTVATLRSSDPTFQELDNILVSEPFTVIGLSRCAGPFAKARQNKQASCGLEPMGDALGKLFYDCPVPVNFRCLSVRKWEKDK